MFLVEQTTLTITTQTNELTPPQKVIRFISLMKMLTFLIVCYLKHVMCNFGDGVIAQCVL